MDISSTTMGSMRELLRLLFGEADAATWRRLVAILALAVCGSMVAALAPLALKHLVDSLRLGSSSGADEGLPNTLWLGVAYILALVAGRALAECRLLLASQTEQRLNARLSRGYFTQLLALPLGFHTDRSSGGLANGLVQATSACQLGFNSLLQCIPVVTETLTVLVVLMHLGQPALAAILATSALAYGIVFARGALQMRTYGRGVAAASQQLHGHLADSLLNIEAIKCFNAAPTVHQRFATATIELQQRWSGLSAHRARIGLAVGAVFAFSVSSTLWVSASAVTAGSLSIGGFVLAAVYMLQMVRPLELLGMAVRDLAQAIEFARPLLDVMQQRPEEDRQPLTELTEAPFDTVPMERDTEPPGLSFRDVHLAFGPGRSALRGLNLQVPAGQNVAIVGGSGAGKSSVARLLLGLHQPTSGSVLWNGVPLQRMDLETLRSRVAIVTQDTSLLAGTIADNIALGRPGAARAEIEAAACQASLHPLVASLPEGYDTPVGERGLHLSGGERQRIAIARAILMRPQVYIFDEATSMLDAATEAAVLEAIRSVSASCTTLLITHRLAAARQADWIVVMEAGQAVEQGRHAELLARGGAYLRLWRTQPQSEPASTNQGEAATRGVGRCAWATGPCRLCHGSGRRSGVRRRAA
jgi:ABC-type multidrug transport system fused ATPase/permease subunit